MFTWSELQNILRAKAELFEEVPLDYELGTVISRIRRDEREDRVELMGFGNLPVGDMKVLLAFVYLIARISDQGATKENCCLILEGFDLALTYLKALQELKRTLPFGIGTPRNELAK